MMSKTRLHLTWIIHEFCAIRHKIFVDQELNHYHKKRTDTLARRASEGFYSPSKRREVPSLARRANDIRTSLHDVIAFKFFLTVKK